jgi:hypothetical protein
MRKWTPENLSIKHTSKFHVGSVKSPSTDLSIASTIECFFPQQKLFQDIYLLETDSGSIFESGEVD